MAVNPMQRKANNSFLLGILITLLITGAIIAFLLLQLSKLNEEKKKTEAQRVYTYVVTSEIKSGTEIQASQVQGGVEMILATSSETIYDSRIKDSKTGGYKIEADGTYTVKPFSAGLKAKVDLHPGTVITSDLTYTDELIASDIRRQEYNVITLPSQIETGEYVDIRLRLPNGQDYIVISHKQVTIPQINGIDSENCVWLDLSEIEILNMSGAIVEAYRMNGAKLYATRYIEAGIQEAATVTYLPSDEIIALMAKDPNAVQEAKNALFSRNNNSEEKNVIRNPINNAKNNEDAEDNLQDGVQSEIQGLQEEREKYLESLGM